MSQHPHILANPPKRQPIFGKKTYAVNIKTTITGIEKPVNLTITYTLEIEYGSHDFIFKKTNVILDGNPTTDWRKTTGWEALTDDQIESTAQSVNAIMGEYDLGIDDIFPHEDVSRKVDGEGGTVLNAIRARVEELNATATNTSR